MEHFSIKNEMVIYMLINSVTDMIYVGQTWNIDARMKAHWSGVKRRDKKASISRLARAMRETEEECWEYVILERFTPTGDYESDQTMLDMAEDYWIDYTSASEHAIGYNERDRLRAERIRGQKKIRRRTTETPAVARAYGRLSIIRDPEARARAKSQIEAEHGIEPRGRAKARTLEECATIHQAYGMLSRVKDPSERTAMKLRIEEHFRSLPSRG